jgi:tRNA dimethylallyltransferase
MDVGTGKVSLRERAILPHHGLDLRDPDEGYSAGQFARDARGWIEGIRSRDKVPMLVGGTGFFLRALVQPMFPEPELDRKRLKALRGFLNELPMEELRAFVGVLDPDRAELPEEGGRQRLTRAVEMALLTGRPLSEWHEEPGAEPMKGMVFLLEFPREVLYERINRRVLHMVEAGFPREVEGLLKAGYDARAPGMTASGYREMSGFVRGELSLEEAVVETQRSHRRYARRQITWYRHQLPPDHVVLDGTQPTGVLTQTVVDRWNSREESR